MGGKGTRLETPIVSEHRWDEASYELSQSSGPSYYLIDQNEAFDILYIFLVSLRALQNREEYIVSKKHTCSEPNVDEIKLNNQCVMLVNQFKTKME